MKIDNKKFEIALARQCISSIAMREMGFSPQTITKINKGLDIKPSTVGKIAKALNVDVTELLGDDYC